MPRSTDRRPGSGIGALILAAGASRRLGRPKQLVTVEGIPLIRRVTTAAIEAGCAPIWIVVPQFVVPPTDSPSMGPVPANDAPPVVPVPAEPGAAASQRAARDHPEMSNRFARRIEEAVEGLDASTIANPGWAEGMASSIRLGASAAQECRPTLRGLLILVCDQPGLSAAHLTSMIGAFEAGSGRPVASAYSGTLGTPALFGPDRFDALRALHGDQGARSLLRNAANDCIQVSWPEGGRDLDRPEDLEFTDL